MTDRKYTDDPIEKIIADALDGAGIKYRHDDPLDFECAGFAIEVKQFYSARALRQLDGRSDVILIQGRGAAKAFASMINFGVLTSETELCLICQEKRDSDWLLCNSCYQKSWIKVPAALS